MKIRSVTGLFDEANVLEKLTKLGDPLVVIEQHIDFSLFTEKSTKLHWQKARKSKTSERTSCL